MDSPITIILPWPPTINHYWGRRGTRSYLLSKGLAYRKHTAFECLAFQESEIYNKRLELFICAFPPDKRRRDLDNILKCLCDSLQYAKVYKDDSQIDMLYIKRMPELLGHVVVKIKEYECI